MRDSCGDRNVLYLLMSIFWLWYCTIILSDVITGINRVKSIPLCYFLQPHVTQQLPQNKMFNKTSRKKAHPVFRKAHCRYRWTLLMKGRGSKFGPRIKTSQSTYLFHFDCWVVRTSASLTPRRLASSPWGLDFLFGWGPFQSMVHIGFYLNFPSPI